MQGLVKRESGDLDGEGWMEEMKEKKDLMMFYHFSIEAWGVVL